jgi:hypothetical protein
MTGRTQKIICVLMISVLFAGCRQTDSEPSFDQTIEWMQNTPKQHNGQRLENFGLEVKIIAKLTAQNCELKHEVTDFEIYYFDLKDVNTNAFKLEQFLGLGDLQDERFPPLNSFR